MNSKKAAIFLTGATGLIGSYLLKILLENGYKVFCLARTKKSKSAKERVANILKFWDERVLIDNSNGLIVLEGDVTKQDLGLDKKAKDLLKNEIEEVFHCAANITFNLPLEKAREINVGGVKNVLELALEWNQRGKLKKINHMSTAYVCGDYNGVFREDHLELGQGFITTYEQSKFEAEKLINEFRKKGLWIDIFRIPVAGAESATGKTSVFQAFYQMLDSWCMELLPVFPGKGLLFDYIPVDLLCKSIVSIASNGKLKSQNYHPFSTERASLDEILDISSNILGFKPPRLVSFDELESFNLTPSQKMLLDFNVSFFNRKVTLDSTKTIAILKNYGFMFPHLEKEMFLKVLLYFKENKLIKAKRK